MNIDIWRSKPVERIRDLGPNDLNGLMDEAQLKRFFAAWSAYFECRSPHEPHLVWGEHIYYHYAKFVYPTALFMNPYAAAVVADQLVRRMPAEARPFSIAAPSYGAWGLVSALAQRYGWIHQQLTRQAGVRKEQMWIGQSLPPGSLVQLADDLIRGGETLNELMLCVQGGNPKGVEISQKVLAIVNISGQEKIGQFDVVSLMSFKEQRWLPEDCPLCKQGSPTVSEIAPYLYERD